MPGKAIGSLLSRLFAPRGRAMEAIIPAGIGLLAGQKAYDVTQDPATAAIAGLGLAAGSRPRGGAAFLRNVALPGLVGYGGYTEAKHLSGGDHNVGLAGGIGSALVLHPAVVRGQLLKARQAAGFIPRAGLTKAPSLWQIVRGSPAVFTPPAPSAVHPAFAEAAGSTLLKNLLAKGGITAGVGIFGGVTSGTKAINDVASITGDYRNTLVGVDGQPGLTARLDEALRNVSADVENTTSDINAVAKDLATTTGPFLESMTQATGSLQQAATSLSKSPAAAEFVELSKSIRGWGDSTAATAAEAKQIVTKYAPIVGVGLAGLLALTYLARATKRKSGKRGLPGTPAPRRSPTAKVTLRRPGAYAIDLQDDEQTDDKGATAMAKAANYTAQQLAIQPYLPSGNRRQFSPQEEIQVERGLSRWLPQIFQSYGTPMPAMLSSPGKGAFLGALGGAGAGGLIGAHLGGTTGAGVGAAGGAGLGALLMYLSRKAENEGLLDIMQRLPPGATKRDYLGDTVVQRDLDRAQQDQGNAALAALLASRGMKSANDGNKDKRMAKSAFGSNSAPTVLQPPSPDILETNLWSPIGIGQISARLARAAIRDLRRGTARPHGAPPAVKPPAVKPPAVKPLAPTLRKSAMGAASFGQAGMRAGQALQLPTMPPLFNAARLGQVAMRAGLTPRSPVSPQVPTPSTSPVGATQAAPAVETPAAPAVETPAAQPLPADTWWSPIERMLPRMAAPAGIGALAGAGAGALSGLINPDEDEHGRKRTTSSILSRALGLGLGGAAIGAAYPWARDALARVTGDVPPVGRPA